MTGRKIEEKTQGDGAHSGLPAAHNPVKRGGNRESVDDFAAYAFDILQSLREASTMENHKFLRYLMGLAAEEAIRLAEGHKSAAAQYRPKSR